MEKHSNEGNNSERGERIMEKQLNVENNQTDQKKGIVVMKKWAWILLVLILLVLIITEVKMPRWNFGDGRSAPAAESAPKIEPQVDPQELERRFKEGVAEKTCLYRQKNEELLQEFLAQLPTLGESSFRSAENNIEPLVQRTTKMSFCTSLVYKMAKDKLTGSSSLTEELAPIVRESLCVPLENGRLAIDNGLRNFMLKLQENHNRYRVEIAEFAGRKEFQALELDSSQSLTEHLNALEQQLTDFALSKTLAAVSAGLEVVFAQSLYSSIRVVAAHAVAKLTGTVSTSAILAVADGPLPIGDAIAAVVGTAGVIWTGYDIYKVSVKLPEELRVKLNELVSDSRAEFRSEAEKQAREAARQTDEAVLKP